MDLEALKPEQFEKEIELRLKKLRVILEEKEKQLKKQPRGHLRIAQRNGRNQFYHYTDANSPKGCYIRLKNISFARSLAQKDYDIELIKIIQKEMSAIQNLLSTTDNGNAIRKLYEKLCPARQGLITPITLNDQQYVAQWLKQFWVGRQFNSDTPAFYTARGERVRSKSEVIIADALSRHGVPYRYEYPVELCRSNTDRTTITLYPDFLCLNVRTRGEFYWEHFGLMDSAEYSNNAAGKLRLFTENGLLAGRNLIITMETQSEPLSTRTVEQMIEAYLL